MSFAFDDVPQVIYSDEERKFNREITVGLIRSELIYLTNYNLHLAKLMDGGRNSKSPSLRTDSPSDRQADRKFEKISFQVCFVKI